MARHRLSRCLKASSQYARGYATNVFQPTPVAHLLRLPQGEAQGNPSTQTLNHVIINGFIRSIRNQKQISFASVGDGTSLESLQALLTPQQAVGLSTGTAVRLAGSWQKSLNPRSQSHELVVKEVEIIGTSDPATFPLQKKYHSPEFLRSIPHLRTRIPFNSALLRLRSESISHITAFFEQRSFVQTHTPIITSSDCEGAGEAFRVESGQRESSDSIKEEPFFRSPKYLTVSSQLHLEALAQSLTKVWTLSPTFRAERSDTARHLSEFYMLEAEMSFTDTMEDVMTLVEDMTRALAQGLSGSQVAEEIIKGSRLGDEEGETLLRRDILERRWNGILHPFGRITYTDAVKLLQSSSEKFEHEAEWGCGLKAEHERYIAKVVGTKGEPVFVTHYPKSTKPFYMLTTPNQTHQETVDCFDLLVPDVCEIAGGSMREHRLDQLVLAMQSRGLLPSKSGQLSDQELEDSGLKWYVDLRRWGSVPHGGFGLGFDRLLAYLAGISNIREMVTFPRWAGRCDC